MAPPPRPSPAGCRRLSALSNPALAARKAELIARSTALRQDLQQQLQTLSTGPRWWTSAQAGLEWLAGHPWLPAAGLLWLAWRRPRAALRWAWRTWGWWRTGRRIWRLLRRGQVLPFASTP